MMRCAVVLMLACAVTAHAMVGTAAAQVPETRFESPDTEFPQEFSSIRGLRELPDGTLLLADGLGQALVVVNLDAATADTIGRVGGGPEEYRQPDGLFPLPGDSTLLVDLGNGRLTALGPDLTFGPTQPIMQGAPRPGAMQLRLPTEWDASGGMYLEAMRSGPEGRADSAAVLRWDRRGDALDTVAMVKLEEVDVDERGGPGNRSVMMRPRPLTARDGWAVSPDGRVGLVRSADYHVEWVHPDGSVVRGQPVAYRPVRVGSAEKEAWMAELGRDGLMVSMEMNNGQARASFRRGGGPPPGMSADDLTWPDVMPAFRAQRVYAPPDGTLWVERYGAAVQPKTIDVFDRNARLVRQIQIPTDRLIVGFGEGVVYLARVDEFDLQWLERYRLPG